MFVDPVTIVAVSAVILGFSRLFKPLYDVMRSKLLLQSDRKLKFLIHSPDGTVTSHETVSHKKTMSEEEIKKLVALLLKAADEKSKDASKK